MAVLPARAAAYTRTGILRRFLEMLSSAPPQRVDNGYAEERMGLKGGDVRAFLQSLRVLGLIDPYGELTDRARRTRAATQRAAALREGLADAYPELVRLWDRRGALSREEIEDFFKVEYGLSASTAGPAAKLFLDLMREYGSGVQVFGASGVQDKQAAGASLSRLRGTPEHPNTRTPEHLPSPTHNAQHPTPPEGQDVRLAALEAIKASLKIDINERWDEDRINLVFDRMERLVGMLTNGAEVTHPERRGASSE